MFQSTVRRFAREQIGPHVREMDEHAKLKPEIRKQFFDLGLMSIEIPEDHGGQVGSVFQSVFAVEEIAAVEPGAAVVVELRY